MSAHSQRASVANDPRRHWLVRHWFVHGILATMRANPDVDFGSIRGVCCADTLGGKAQEEDPNAIHMEAVLAKDAAHRCERDEGVNETNPQVLMLRPTRHGRLKLRIRWRVLARHMPSKLPGSDGPRAGCSSVLACTGAQR